MRQSLGVQMSILTIQIYLYIQSSLTKQTGLFRMLYIFTITLSLFICGSLGQIEFCDTEILGDLSTRQLTLCEIAENWLNAPGPQRGQFVTDDFSVYHYAPAVVPFSGLYGTAPGSELRNDLFLERGAIFFDPELITDWATVGRTIIAVSDENVILTQNLTGTAVITGKAFNSKTIVTWYFVDGELDYLGQDSGPLSNYLEIWSDPQPLSEAFTSKKEKKDKKKKNKRK